MIKILSQAYSVRRNKVLEKIICLGDSDWDFFDAIDANEIHNFDDNTSQKRYERQVSNPEKSCAVSHFKIITDDKTNLVFEDDFKLLTKVDFKEIVDQLNNLKHPAVLILGHSRTSPRDFWLQKLKQPLINKHLIANRVVGENYKINFYGAVGYAFNDEFKCMMRSVESVSWVADDWHTIKEISKCRIYQLWDKIIIEDIDETYLSSLENKVHFRHDSRKKIISNIFKALRAQLIYILNQKYFSYDSNHTQ
jgi:GR25 family glycosyltransferase involved in LPS biosynthesis